MFKKLFGNFGKSYNDNGMTIGYGSRGEHVETEYNDGFGRTAIYDNNGKFMGNGYYDGDVKKYYDSNGRYAGSEYKDGDGKINRYDEYGKLIGTGYIDNYGCDWYSYTYGEEKENKNSNYNTLNNSYYSNDYSTSNNNNYYNNDYNYNTSCYNAYGLLDEDEEEDDYLDIWADDDDY